MHIYNRALGLQFHCRFDDLDFVSRSRVNANCALLILVHWKNKKIETELTASVLRKDQKPTKGSTECFLIRQNKTKCTIFLQPVVFILFSTEENLVSFLCCCFAQVPPPLFTGYKAVPSVAVHFVY